MAEKRGGDRRGTDPHFVEIKVFMEKMNNHMETAKTAHDQVWKNKDKITAMNVKIWLACLALAALVGNTVRKLF